MIAVNAKTYAIGFLAALCSACAVPQPQSADRQIAAFRAAFNAGRYEAVDALMVERGRGSARAGPFRSFLEQTRARLGVWRRQELLGASRRLSFRRPPALELRYRSTFENGERYERFLLELEQGQARIRSYHFIQRR